MESTGAFSIAFISTLLFALCQPSLSYYEFEGGIIMWRAVEPYSNSTEIEISYRLSERQTCSIGQLAYMNGYHSGSYNTYLYCRSGCSGSITYMRFFYCYDNNPGIYATGGRSVTYNPSVASFEASYLNSRWVYLQRRGHASWELRMKYKYIRRSGKMNSSPVTAMAEVVGVQYGCTYTIKIPVADYDGDNVRCRWASSGLSECGGVCEVLPGSFLNERTCELQYNSRGQSTGYYAVAIQIEDFASSTDTVPLSSIPLQFLVNVLNVGSCGQEPWIVDATLTDGAVGVITLNVNMTANFNYDITAQAFFGTSISAILATITPFGIQLYKSSLTRDDDNQWSVRISWSPSESDIGSHMLCYYAMDSNGLTSNQSCVTLVVQEDIDECVLLQDDCSQVCINTIGSYECGCRKGYKLRSDGRTCVGVQFHFDASQKVVKEQSVYFVVYLVVTLGHGKVLDNLTIDLKYHDITAELGIDYQPADYVAHFTANTAKSSPIRINIIDDNGWEESETFIISFTIPDGVDALKGEPEEAIITILDNDVAEFHFSTDQITIAPGATQQAVQLVTKQSLLWRTVITISCLEVVPDGGADNLGRYSFDATNSTDKFDIGVKYNVTFTKHASSSTYAMVDIPDHANCIECLIWQPEVRGLRRICPAVMHMNVPVQGSTYIEFDYKHYYGKEGESVVIGLHASQPIIRKFRVAVSVSKFKRTDTHSRAEALSGADYEPPNNVSGGSVRFDPSLGLNSTYLELFLHDDGVVESIEYFVLTFTIDSYLQSLGILPGPRDETIVAIEDDDRLYLQFQYETYVVNESDKRLIVKLEVLQVDPLIDNAYCPAKHSIQISVVISTREELAENGTDYIEKTERVRFFPGDRYSTEMDIIIVDDDVAEPKETFYLHFEVPEGLEPKVELLTNKVPVVIVDDEWLEIVFTDSSYLLMEDDDLLFVQLIMNGTSSLPISVTVKPVYGSAKEFVDYFTDGVENVAVFQPNTTVSSVAIIRIINDNIPEETESFYLTLEIHNDTNEELNIIDSTLSTTATILDDDHDGFALSVNFEHTKLSGREGTVLNVTVVRKGNLSQPLAVPVTQQTITAKSHGDYKLQTTYLLFSSLGSLEEKHNVMVKLQRDSNREEPELFLLYLHPPPGVECTKQNAIIKILP